MGPGFAPIVSRHDSPCSTGDEIFHVDCPIGVKTVNLDKSRRALNYISLRRVSRVVDTLYSTYSNFLSILFSRPIATTTNFFTEISSRVVAAIRDQFFRLTERHEIYSIGNGSVAESGWH